MNQEIKKASEEETVTLGKALEFAAGEAGVASELPDLCGRIFAEKYEITELLGKGGMSAVYKARHLSMHKIVALKLLHGHLDRDELSRKRFRQEAQASSNLSHPGITGVYDFGEDESGISYLVMEYIEGESLSTILRETGTLSEERFLSIFQQVTSALAHAHEHGVVHRDLKPSNIMISTMDGKDHARVVDFGIAKLVGASAESAQQLTQTGEIFGSPLYMSPEQCSGTGVDGRSDIYSLGCVMYQTLTGDVPFRGDNAIETIQKHVNEPPPPLEAPQLGEEARQRLEIDILRCLAKLPEQRFQKMSEIEAELRALQLKTKSGIFKSLGGKWDLAAARRKARKASRLPLLIAALAASFLSTGLLFYALFQNQACMEKLQRSQKVVFSVVRTQNEFLITAEVLRNLFSSMVFDNGYFEVHRRRFNTQRKRLRLALNDLDYAICSVSSDDCDDKFSFGDSMDFQRRLMEPSETMIVTVDQLESARNAGLRSANSQTIAIAQRMSSSCKEGCMMLRTIANTARKRLEFDTEQIRASQKQVGMLASICGLINSVVLIALTVYFARDTRERLRKISESARQLSRKQKPDQTISSRDEIADLDSVLQELATALNDAEDREKALLQKLKLQEQNPELKQDRNQY